MLSFSLYAFITYVCIYCVDNCFKNCSLRAHRETLQVQWGEDAVEVVAVECEGDRFYFLFMPNLWVSSSLDFDFVEF